MTSKDIGAVEEARIEESHTRVDNTLPIEAIMYHESKHLNEEAVDEIQADRKPWELGDGYDQKMDRRLIWKIDLRLIPTLAVIYGISVIDRYLPFDLF
jgi:hypothetical protein